MRSTTGKVKLDEVRLAKAEDKYLRRIQKMQEKVFNIRKMREGLKAAVTISKGA